MIFILYTKQLIEFIQHDFFIIYTKQLKEPNQLTYLPVFYTQHLFFILIHALVRLQIIRLLNLSSRNSQTQPQSSTIVITFG